MLTNNLLLKQQEKLKKEKETYKNFLKNNLDLYDLTIWDKYEPALKLIEKYFQFSIKDFDNIPSRKPALIIGFHGLFSVDVLLLSYHIYKRYGKMLRMLTDRRMYNVPVIRELVGKLGAVEGSHKNGEDLLLKKKELLLIMPGGAKECWKSSFRKYEIMWGKRRGFIKLAIRTKTPIIPIFPAGIEELYFNPFNGIMLTEKLFGKELPVPLSIPMGIGFLPFPSKITLFIGKPIDFSKFSKKDAENENLVEEQFLKVKGAMQALIDKGLSEKKPPLYAFRKGVERILGNYKN